MQLMGQVRVHDTTVLQALCTSDCSGLWKGTWSHMHKGSYAVLHRVRRCAVPCERADVCASSSAGPWRALCVGSNARVWAPSSQRPALSDTSPCVTLWRAGPGADRCGAALPPRRNCDHYSPRRV
jgi:hypothetical protein